jgi:hypothetical protein
MKITIPKIAAHYGGNLFELYYKIAVVDGDNITRTQNNGTITLSGNYELTISEILDILNEGGEIEEYLMAIRADIDILGDLLPDIENIGATPPIEELPNIMTVDNTGTEEVRAFKNWFGQNCSFWKKDDNTQIYFTTNPVGTSVAQYLKGSQLRALFQAYGGGSPTVVDRNLLVRTISDYQLEVASGWTQIIF